MNAINTTAGLNGEPITIDSETAYRVALTGRDGLDKFALLDGAGLNALRAAGARALYLVTDKAGNQYVTFLRATNSQTTAARVVIDAPTGRRVAYRNGDRRDLRTANLFIQPRKDEEAEPMPYAKYHQVRRAWQVHERLRRDQAQSASL